MNDSICVYNNINFALIGNILLILILICIVIYYYYISTSASKSTKEHFDNDTNIAIESGIESSGCFTGEQYDMNVDTRKCNVYYTDEEIDCENNFEYYRMTDVEIDLAISEALENNDTVLHEKLLKIKDYLEINNYRSCRLNYDGWKEINTFYDDKESRSSNYEYPTKNAFDNNSDYNYDLLNNCFTNKNTFKDITFNSSVKSACTTPIKNLHDISKPEEDVNGYISMSFVDYDYDNIYSSICTTQTQNELINVPSNKIFLKLSCVYNYEDKSISYNKIALVRYSNDTKDFAEVETTDDNLNYTKRLFKLFYSKENKRIMHVPLRNNLNAYIVKYNYCKNIEKYYTKNIVFNFKDFNINGVIVNAINLNKVPDLIDYFDEKIMSDDENDKNKLKLLISEVINILNDENNNYKDIINKIRKEIADLTDISNENKKKISQPLEMQKYVKEILEARNNTDTVLYNYIEFIKQLKTEIDTEFNKFKQTGITNSDFNNSLLTKNNNLLKMCNDVNNARDMEYKVCIDTITNIYNYTIDLIKSNFLKGAYFTLNLYNKGFLTKTNPKNVNEFTDYIVNMQNADNITGVINTQTDIFYHNNRYVSNPGRMLYYTLEVSSSIKFETGYYYFFMDLYEEEAADVFIGYPDPNNKENMVFKCVAQYYYNSGGTNKLRKDIGDSAANISNSNNKTTKFPIYIDGELNNGYYAFYYRSHREISTLRNNYINVKYKMVTNLPTNNTSYDLVNTVTYEFVSCVSLRINSGTSVNDLLYLNNNIKPDNTSVYYYYNNLQNSLDDITFTKDAYGNSQLIYPFIEEEIDYILYWWNFDKSLIDNISATRLVSNKKLLYNVVYTTNIMYGNNSLQIKAIGTAATGVANEFKYSCDITLPESFSISLWANVNSCCNKIFAIDNDLYIEIKKNRNGNVVVYINGENFNSDLAPVPVEFNVWNMFVINYEGISKTLTFYYNGNFKFEKSFNISSGNKKMGLFSQTTNDSGTIDAIVMYNDLRIYKEILSVNDVLVLYNNINTTRIYPRLTNEKYFIGHWWDFNNTFLSRVSDASLNPNGNGAVYEFDPGNIKYGFNSLKAIGNVPENNEALFISNNFNLTENFTWSFWANATGCCNRIASLGDDLFIEIIKATNGTDIVFVNNISVNSSYQQAYQVANPLNCYQVGSESCTYYNDYSSSDSGGSSDRGSLYFYSAPGSGGSYGSWTTYDSGGFDSVAFNSGTVYNERDFDYVSVDGKARFTNYDKNNSEHTGLKEKFTNYKNDIIEKFGQSCTTSYSTQCDPQTYSTLYRTIYVIQNTVVPEYNKWNLYILSYDASKSSLKFYYNNKLIYEKKGYVLKSNSVNLKLFKKVSANPNIYYGDMRIHEKILTDYEMEVLYNNYYNIPESKQKIIDINKNTIEVTDVDPKIRFYHPMFYVYCPLIPKITKLPEKSSVTLVYVPLKMPTVSNASKINYVPIYTQDKNNTENFAKINEILDELEKLRDYSTYDYNCIIEDYKKLLADTVTDKSIGNKNQLINNYNNSIILNENKIIDLNVVYNQIADFDEIYNYDSIESTIANNVLISKEADFNNYRKGIFKNLKDDRYYMYLELF